MLVKTILLSPALLLFTCLTAGAQQLHLDRSYPEFAFGPTGILATIERGHEVTVTSILPGTPADGSALEAGDVITVACGLDVGRVLDARVPLGYAIGLAEANDGLLELEYLRGGEEHELTLQLPSLGAYADSWPADCEKSAAIIGANAILIL